MTSRCEINKVYSAVLLIGFVYMVYSFYFSVRRLQPLTWNTRKSLVSFDQLAKNFTSKPSAGLPTDITLVTAYFKLGNLDKGGFMRKYTPELYKSWMSIFGQISNPLIVFTDSQDVKELFTEQRRLFPKTKIFFTTRSSLWSFSIADEIKSVFSQPGYPDFDPNTVHENYSCAMHAKFELVNKVIRENLYSTKYVSWLDIGLFRAVVYSGDKRTFTLRVPSDIDDSKVSYSQQRDFLISVTTENIIRENKVWVGGAMFFGRPEVVFTYTEDYIKAVKALLSMKLMSTDQQVIYCMYTEGFAFRPRVEIQVHSNQESNDWFHLGYKCREIWDKEFRQNEPLIKQSIWYI